MKSLIFPTLLFAFLMGNCQPKHANSHFEALVFSKTAGFRHESIPAGIAAIEQLGRQHGFGVEATEVATWFTPERLSKYQVVIFLNTTLDVLDMDQQASFEQYIRSGGGFVGIHSAADTEYEWPWFGKLVGGYFNGHPKDLQTATIQVVDKQHPSTRELPANWERKDEWYNFKSLNPDIRVLCKLDETTYEGGTNGPNHPIAWYHAYDGGRSFYTGSGHTAESFAEPLFLQHLLGGIQYAAGMDKP